MLEISGAVAAITGGLAVEALTAPDSLVSTAYLNASQVLNKGNDA